MGRAGFYPKVCYNILRNNRVGGICLNSALIIEDDPDINSLIAEALEEYHLNLTGGINHDSFH